MPTMQIVPSFINAPGVNKKMGNVKLPDNSIMLALPAILNQMQSGQTYEVEYTEPTPSFNYRTIKAVKPMEAAWGSTGNNGAITGTASISPAMGGQRQDQSEHIFCCGAINNAISAGQLNVLNGSDIVRAVQILRQVWQRTFGNKQQNTIIEDEIPF